jgi:hypothetical protein
VALLLKVKVVTDNPNDQFVMNAVTTLLLFSVFAAPFLNKLVAPKKARAHVPSIL